MGFLGYLILIGVVVFSVWQIFGMIKDIKARVKRKKGVIEEKSSEEDVNVDSKEIKS